MFNLIKGVIENVKVQIEEMRTQCFDGVANMSGCYNGVSARFQEREPRAVYIHCHAHVLNLSLTKACSMIQDARNTLGALDNLYTLLEGSAKRHSHFKIIQETLDASKPALTLKRVCQTRWSSRDESVCAVKLRVKAIIVPLDAIASTDPHLGPDATRLLNFIETFRFLFYIIALEAILGKTAVLSDYLQGEQIELLGVKTMISCTIDTLKMLRDDFQVYWNEAEVLAGELGLEMPSPRKRKPPTRIDSNTADAY